MVKVTTYSCKDQHDDFTEQELEYLSDVVWLSEEEFNKLTEQHEEVTIEVDDLEKNVQFAFNGVVIED